jgi:CHASE3 domain sensor protein
LAVYYLFAMGRIVDRIVNVDAPTAKLAEQVSIKILEARRTARNYVLFQDPEYLRSNQEALTKVRQMLVRIGDLEPDEAATVQEGLDTVSRYQQQFASAVPTMTEPREEPEALLREAVLAYENDLDALVKTARHEKRAQLVHELHARVVSFDSRITEAVQRANPALRQVAPDLRA